MLDKNGKYSVNGQIKRQNNFQIDWREKKLIVKEIKRRKIKVYRLLHINEQATLIIEGDVDWKRNRDMETMLNILHDI